MTAHLSTSIVGFSHATQFAWPLVLMRDICKLNYGKALKSEARVPGSVPVYGSNGQTGKHSQALGTGPTVVLGRKGQGNLGVEWVEGPFWVIDTAYYVTFEEKVDPRYFYYFVDFVGLNHLKDGTSNPSLSRDVFNVQLFPLPPRDVQERVSNVLSAFDDKTELNRRTSETLEEMAQAIFHDWFVDFGPVRRKLLGEIDPIAIMGGLITDPVRSAELAALFPANLTNDGLPDGWTDQPIGDQIQIAGGATPSTADDNLWHPAEHCWATPKDLSNTSDLALFETGRRISSAGLKKITSGLLPVGTVLLSSRAPIGYLAIAQEPVAINQGFIALKPTRDLNSAFLYLWCKANMEAILANANGSTFQEISKKNFRTISSATPADPTILRAFGEIAQPLIDRIVAAARENRTLAETRDYLLPRLMSGELRVRSSLVL